MKHQNLWLTVVLAISAGTASADEEHAVKTFERLGATVTRDETRPGKPVVSVRFGDGTGTDEEWELSREDLISEGHWYTAAELVTDAELMELKAFPLLEKLDLSSSHITDDGLKALEALGNLQVLDLRRTEIGGAGLKAVEKLEAHGTLFDLLPGDRRRTGASTRACES